MPVTYKNSESTQLKISSITDLGQNLSRHGSSVFTRIDLLFMSLQLRSELIEARFSSRLGRHFRNALANLHETYLNLSRYYGLSRVEFDNVNFSETATPKA